MQESSNSIQKFFKDNVETIHKVLRILFIVGAIVSLITTIPVIIGGGILSSIAGSVSGTVGTIGVVVMLGLLLLLIVDITMSYLVIKGLGKTHPESNFTKLYTLAIIYIALQIAQIAMNSSSYNIISIIFAFLLPVILFLYADYGKKGIYN